MTLLFTVLAIAVVGLVAAVAVGRIGGGLDAPASSLPSRGLPPGPVDPQDLDQVRFSPALRGYRMDEVDALLDRLALELARRDEELRRLREELDRPDRSPGPGGPSGGPDEWLDGTPGSAYEADFSPPPRTEAPTRMLRRPLRPAEEN